MSARERFQRLVDSIRSPSFEEYSHRVFTNLSTLRGRYGSLFDANDTVPLDIELFGDHYGLSVVRNLLIRDGGVYSIEFQNLDVSRALQLSFIAQAPGSDANRINLLSAGSGFDVRFCSSPDSSHTGGVDYSIFSGYYFRPDTVLTTGVRFQVATGLIDLAEASIHV